MAGLLWETTIKKIAITTYSAAFVTHCYATALQFILIYHV